MAEPSWMILVQHLTGDLGEQTVYLADGLCDGDQRDPSGILSARELIFRLSTRWWGKVSGVSTGLQKTTSRPSNGRWGQKPASFTISASGGFLCTTERCTKSVPWQISLTGSGSADSASELHLFLG